MTTNRSSLGTGASTWGAGNALAQPLVLVVDDEVRMRRFLVSALATHGFRSLQTGTRDLAPAQALRGDPDLVLLDVGSGDKALSVTTRLREGTSAPILLLLEIAREPQTVQLLDAGANDYVVKPFVASDLFARMRVWLRQSARMRRVQMPPSSPADRLRIDREGRSLFVDGREVHMTPTERTLLSALLYSRGAMSEADMVDAVWGRGATPQAPQHLRAYVRQLRYKIEKDPMRPRHLVSDSGGGYRLKLG